MPEGVNYIISPEVPITVGALEWEQNLEPDGDAKTVTATERKYSHDFTTDSIGDWQHLRDSPAYGLDSNGLLQQVPSDAPVLVEGEWNGSAFTQPSKGLRIEKPAENIALHSEDFAEAVWSSTLTVAPVPPGANLTGSGVLTQAVTAGAELARTVSFCVKRLSGNGQIEISAGNDVWVDVSAPIGADYVIVSATETATSHVIGIRVTNDGNDAGDTSIHLRYAQLQDGTVSSSYAPSSATPGSRPVTDVSHTIADMPLVKNNLSNNFTVRLVYRENGDESTYSNQRILVITSDPLDAYPDDYFFLRRNSGFHAAEVHENGSRNSIVYLNDDDVPPGSIHDMRVKVSDGAFTVWDATVPGAKSTVAPTFTNPSTYTDVQLLGPSASDLVIDGDVLFFELYEEALDDSVIEAWPTWVENASTEEAEFSLLWNTQGESTNTDGTRNHLCRNTPEYDLGAAHATNLTDNFAYSQTGGTPLSGELFPSEIEFGADPSRHSVPNIFKGTGLMRQYGDIWAPWNDYEKPTGGKLERTELHYGEPFGAGDQFEVNEGDTVWYGNSRYFIQLDSNTKTTLMQLTVTSSFTGPCQQLQQAIDADKIYFRVEQRYGNADRNLTPGWSVLPNLPAHTGIEIPIETWVAVIVKIKYSKGSDGELSVWLVPEGTYIPGPSMPPAYHRRGNTMYLDDIGNRFELRCGQYRWDRDVNPPVNSTERYTSEYHGPWRVHRTASDDGFQIVNPFRTDRLA